MTVQRLGRLVVPLVLLAVSACGPLESISLRSLDPAGPAKPEAEAPSPAEPKAETTPPDRTARVRRSLSSHLQAGRYRQALEALQRARRQGVAVGKLVPECRQALDGILIRAQERREQGKPQEAGRLYQTALEVLEPDSPWADEFEARREQFLAYRQDCADRLMERGLAAYRQGALEKAIRIWEGIATFHPRHQASQKALQTARTQSSNLKKLNTGS